jgi:hypothetical protein
VVGQHPVPHASAKRDRAVAAGRSPHQPQGLHRPTPPTAPDGGYALLRECVSGARDVESVIADDGNSGLRGLGGAGFPAGRKWRIVRAEAGPRLMAVNIDEGEPGTFKDRHYLERDPHRFLEGALIAAWAVGIETIYIYLRDEYHGCRACSKPNWPRCAPIRRCWACPKIVLRRGAGAYICGEESAMIESIEGKRGMPRLRPPYVAQVGLFGRPTLEHNFETLHWVRDIVKRAATGSAATAQRPQGPAFVLGVGPGARARRQAGAGRHHHPGADRRILRRHAGRPDAFTATCRAAPRAASCRPR